MARNYGQEPENAVKFNFDEGNVGFVERTLIKVFTSQTWADMDVLCVRYFGGSATTKLTSIAKDMPHQKTLVLKTIGAKTGQVRTCALPYVMDEGRYCMVGTRAGGPIHPAWVLNLRRNPACWAWIDRKYTPCRAEEAPAEDRQRVIDHLRDEFGDLIDEYEQTAHPRVIAVMMLTPCTQYR
jgi:deazaflavin-dependent oxidoreductase (nitroreductase family)